jgi:PiT family inorganic phosphate transporter
MSTLDHWLQVGYTVVEGKVKINHIPEWIPIAVVENVTASQGELKKYRNFEIVKK